MAEDDLTDRLDEWARLLQLPPSDGGICRCDVTDATCCATYVGPAYDATPVPILFVGLDAGQSWKGRLRFLPAKIVQHGILEGYAHGERTWNPHYQGCVRVTAEILQLACKSSCLKKCMGNESTNCALNCFGQANAVRCVSVNSKGMTFGSHNRVQKCLPFLFQQIGILRPKVIVLQGRNEGTGLIHESFKRELSEGKWGRLKSKEVNYVQLIEWQKFGGFMGPTILASLRHPSARGRRSLLKSWDSHFVPAVETIRNLLSSIEPL
jgi:hypothetical protein